MVTAEVAASGLVTAIGSIIVSVGGAAGLIGFLTIKQARRKIAGDASSAEANAASTLSGAALKMVEQYQKGEASAKRDAQVAKDEAQRLWKQLYVERWQSYAKDTRIALLEGMLTRANLLVPPADPKLMEPPPEVLSTPDAPMEPPALPPLEPPATPA